MSYSQKFSLSVDIEAWPLANPFTISRDTKTEVKIVIAEISDGHFTGRGECVPYSRYGETAEGVAKTLEKMKAVITKLDRTKLQEALPAGAARNALDCAFWDFEAKSTGKRVYELIGIANPKPLDIFCTISLDSPAEMEKAAKKAGKEWRRLKIKLGSQGDAERIKAVRNAAPDAVIIADANEGWTIHNIEENMIACADAKIALIEQPLPSGNDDILSKISRTVPVCADESAHDRKSLLKLKGKYDAINIKLDKTGGLTEALLTLEEAEKMGFSIMVGCMVSTSLSIAPAVVLAQKALFADLDGAFLLACDRPHGLHYTKGKVGIPEPSLWG